MAIKESEITIRISPANSVIAKELSTMLNTLLDNYRTELQPDLEFYIHLRKVEKGYTFFQLPKP